MGFDQEWSRLRSAAAESAGQESASTRLNGTGGGGGTGPGGTGTLASSPAQKRAAADAIAGEITTQTNFAATRPNEAMGAAIAAFGGWDTCAGLKKVKETWESQVKTLKGRLSTEEARLRQTRTSFMSTDVGTYNEFGLIPPKTGGQGQ
ncbi:hypothetical protein AMK26_12935 [Streptomyces sp. CB03234]|uniref:hypothetical protein n=1 Tax=Streptomyces sp. (strain CB03234) TaxID=1703937 RepID=UPI00093BF2C6|nr:hypothetical protein [Streptomyces sp. CB03234]OKK07018.1 hypothetical protein AMK26_12935 [Streptomyces sp. CB03234]